MNWPWAAVTCFAMLCLTLIGLALIVGVMKND